MSELFDVVDEHDHVLRQEQRHVVHAEKLLHRAVHVFVINAAGKLYVQLRSPTKDEYPNRWTSSCSGHVDAGEDYDAAAIRELQEELGLVVEQLERLHKFPASEETSYEHTVLYRLQTDAPVSADPQEIAGLSLMPMHLIETDIAVQPDRYCPCFRTLFAWYRRNAAAF